MKQFKLRKWYKSIGVLTVMSPIAIALPICFSAANNLALGQFVYEGKTFSSYDAATRYVLANNNQSISQKEVLGSLEAATVDSTFGMLDKSKLPDYDTSKTHFAYEAALGGLTPSSALAQSSHANMGLAREEFTFNGAQTSYHSLSAATKARNLIDGKTQIVSMARVNDPTENDGKKVLYFNPHSASDIEELKSKVVSALPRLTHLQTDSNGWSVQDYSFDTLADGSKKYYPFLDGRSDDPQLDLDIMPNLTSFLKLVGDVPNRNLLYFTPNGGLTSQFGLSLQNAAIPKLFGHFNFDVSGVDYWNRDAIGSFNKIDYVTNLEYKVMSSEIKLADFIINERPSGNNGTHTEFRKNFLSSKYSLVDLSVVNKQTIADLLILENAKPLQLIMPYQQKVHDMRPNLLKDLEKIKSWKIDKGLLDLTSFLKFGSLDLYASHSVLTYEQDSGFSGLGRYRHELKPRKFTIRFEMPITGYSANLGGYIRDSFVRFAKHKNRYAKIIFYKDEPLFVTEKDSSTHIDDLLNISSFLRKTANNKFAYVIEPNTNITVASGVAPLLAALKSSIKPNEFSESLLNTIVHNNNDISVVSNAELFMRNHNQEQLYSSATHYAKYWQELVLFVKNHYATNGHSDHWPSVLLKDLKERKLNVILKPNEIMQLKPSLLTFKVSLLLPTGLNYSFFGSSRNTYLLDLNDTTNLELQSNRYLPGISTCWVFYDQFGIKSLSSETSKFDSKRFDPLELVMLNLKRINPLRISLDKVFVEGYDVPITSTISSIYEYSVGGKKLYFRDFTGLYNYVMNLIKQSLVVNN